MNIRLDHIGYLGQNTNRMITTFEALGFHVTEPAPLHLGKTDATRSAAVQSSAHILFRDSYIELTSVNPCPPGHHLEPLMGLDEGIRLLILNTPNAEQAKRNLQAEGCPVSAVRDASRQLTYGGHETVRFRWFTAPADTLPGTLLGWVEQLSGRALFDVELMQHPNTVTGIASLRHQPGPLPAFLAADERGVRLEEDEGGVQGGGYVSSVEFLARNTPTCAAVLKRNAVPFKWRENVIEVAPVAAAGARLLIRPLS